MSVVPEVDSPSHNNAIVMSDTATPATSYLTDTRRHQLRIRYPTSLELHRAVVTAVCARTAPTRGPFTRRLPSSWRDVQQQVLRPWRYEAHPFTRSNTPNSSTRSQESSPLTQDTNGWPTGSPPPAHNATRRVGSRVLSPGAADGAAAVQKGMQVVMAPADHAYLDQSYPHDSASGLAWLGLSRLRSGCEL